MHTFVCPNGHISASADPNGGPCGWKDCNELAVPLPEGAAALVIAESVEDDESRYGTCHGPQCAHLTFYLRDYIVTNYGAPAPFGRMEETLGG